MILPPCFWTEEELKSIPDEDIWCEIADMMFFSSPEIDSYVQRMNLELNRRKSVTVE
jgi:hypothetical protein